MFRKNEDCVYSSWRNGLVGLEDWAMAMLSTVKKVTQGEDMGWVADGNTSELCSLARNYGKCETPRAFVFSEG